MAGRKLPLKVYLICFLTLLVNVCAKEYVPALIWESSAPGKEEISTPALAKLSSDDFSDYIYNLLSAYKEKPLVVVFAEDTLSIEDFSWNDANDHNSFPMLERVTKKSSRVRYLPSVHTPLAVLKGLGNQGFTIKSVNIGKESQVPTTVSDGTVLIIKMDDAKSDEDRPQLLKRHDQVIGDVYSQLLVKHSHIVSIYTGHYSSFSDTDMEPLHRVRRLLESNDTEVAADSPPRLWNDAKNRVYIYFSKSFPVFLDSSAAEPKPIEFNEKPTSISFDERSNPNLQRLIVTISGKTLRFRFPSSPSGYWTLPTIEYEDGGTTLFLSTNSLIEAPYNFSYHCGDKMVFRNGTKSITLSDIQLQPYLVNTKFSDSYDCVWFFTAPIWTGIFITFLLALIMTWGLTMIMDIKTMDRFDDPKGKTITINTNE